MKARSDGNRQLHTPWADGVPGLTQWAIQPGESYTYRWHANDYGTYWYEYKLYWPRNTN